MNRKEEGQLNVKTFALSVLSGASVALILCAVLLLVVSGMILAGWIGESMSWVVMIILLFLCAGAGGIVSAKKHGSKYIITGGATGLCMFVLICIIGLLFYNNFWPSNGGIPIFCSVLAGAVLGANPAVHGKKFASKNLRNIKKRKKI